jgi:hypothetical protein
MSITAQPLAEINQTAIRLLCQEMGVVNTIRFLNQFTVGYGNYTTERDALFGNVTVADVVAEIKRSHGNADKPDLTRGETPGDS